MGNQEIEYCIVCKKPDKDLNWKEGTYYCSTKCYVQNEPKEIKVCWTCGKDYENCNANFNECYYCGDCDE